MILTPSMQVDHMSTFMSSSSKVLRPVNTSSKAKSAGDTQLEKSCNVDNKVQIALQGLNLKQDVSKLPRLASTTPARALQPVDTNLSKADRQQATSSLAGIAAPSTPKRSANRAVTRKNRSPSSRDLATKERTGKTSLSIVCLSEANPHEPSERICVKVPQKLPVPRLKPNSSPYEDLAGHLARHHFFAESESVADSSITPDFFLTKYLEMAHLGKCSLYHQTGTFLDANRDAISAYIKPGELLPPTVPIDVTELVAGLQVPPTHLLAVHSDSQGATMYAVHGVVLALQCVSIPFLSTSKTRGDDGRLVLDMPTVALRVPAPEHFSTILRWLYSQSSTSLLQELIPLKHITAYLARRRHARAKEADIVEKDESGNAKLSKLSAADLVEAMSTLPTRTFLDMLKTIQLVWKNGAALGIVSFGFWNQLNNAWGLTVSAMAASKKKGQKKLAAVAAATASELSSQLQSTRLQ